MSKAEPSIKREKSPVADMYIWQECVKKENQHLKVYENFTINPSKLYILQEKPNNSIMLQKHLMKSGANPSIFNDFEQSATEVKPLEKELVDKLNSIGQTPRQKYYYPQTASQEVGWHSVVSNDPLQCQERVTPKPSKFTYPRKLCKETNYANDYFTMNKVSPYSNKFK